MIHLFSKLLYMDNGVLHTNNHLPLMKYILNNKPAITRLIKLNQTYSPERQMKQSMQA